jgi:hypothetical protein
MDEVNDEYPKNKEEIVMLLVKSTKVGGCGSTQRFKIFFGLGFESLESRVFGTPQSFD